MAQILIMEDEEILLELYSLFLQKSGHNIFIASDGREGLQKLQHFRNEIDLVILDLLLPKSDGFSIFTEIRTKIDEKMPVIIITGLPETKNSVALTECGPTTILNKPFSRDQLIETVTALLSKIDR